VRVSAAEVSADQANNKILTRLGMGRTRLESKFLEEEK